ncbi:hypothetical protein P3X46_031356 [Hevea brasiliensis]|uniref:Uncharacterized protein n=1 Tax=Hevea brasiliensis TaxID=3981 RepID=A0ABQ9KKU4_HEVBR|nr:uncharacterized protein LOC110633553 [Hevea brasiliensis]KAJ9140748.1 hypothetical protein P3X46_031356 [Hevea brasiliensis]
MEIPVINRIGDFEAGITSLQNPSFPSQVFALSRVEKIHQAYSFCKWGALIVALVASFSTIINRIKILIIRIQNHYLIPSQPPPLSADEDFDYSSETDTSCSSVSEDDDYDEEEEEYEPGSSSSQGWRYIDDDFSVRGSGHYTDDQWHNRNLRRRRNSSLEDLFSSWSEFSNGKNVVKLWDNLGFGFGLNLDNQSRNCISVCDMNKEVNVFSIFGEQSEIPAFSTSSSSPAVIVSAETTVSGHLLRVWDTRVGSRIPEILAEWKPRFGKFVGRSAGGGEKVYVRDDITGRLTVGDMRKVSSPLGNATESDVDTWWDADAVLVEEEESVDELRGGDPVLRRG